MYVVNAKNGPAFENSTLVCILGALRALYVPLEMREGVPEKAMKLHTLGLFMGKENNLPEILQLAKAIEGGKNVCRDIGG